MTARSGLERGGDPYPDIPVIRPVSTSSSTRHPDTALATESVAKVRSTIDPLLRLMHVSVEPLFRSRSPYAIIQSLRSLPLALVLG